MARRTWRHELVEFVVGSAAPPRVFLRHLDGCAACRSEFESARSLAAALRDASGDRRPAVEWRLEA